MSWPGSSDADDEEDDDEEVDWLQLGRAEPQFLEARAEAEGNSRRPEETASSSIDSWTSLSRLTESTKLWIERKKKSM